MRPAQDFALSLTDPAPSEIDPRAVLHALPLADAVVRLFAYLLNPLALEAIFQVHRGRSFEKVLSFATFTHLIADALIQHKGSARQAIQRADENGLLLTSNEAVYGKLRRVPVSLSLGLFLEVAPKLAELYPASTAAWHAPKCLDRMTPVILDGKTLKNIAKRLKSSRHAPGKISGGKLLVAVTPRDGLVLGMTADLDGETNEAKLVPDLLPRLREHVPGPVLWIADRQFGDTVQIERFLARPGDHVLVRWDGRTTFHPQAERTQTTTDARGRTIREEWGWLGAESNPRRRFLRRITLIRPGQEDIMLVTDLADATAYPATDLLEVYLERWEIERVFQRITEVFSLARLIGSTAEATIFQGAFCLLLYNVIQVVRAIIAEGSVEVSSVEEVSSEQLFSDVNRQLISLTEMVEAPQLAEVSRHVPERGELSQWLSSRLASVWTSRWRKAVNKKPRAKRRPQGNQFGAHNSVHRLREAARAKATEPKPPS